MRGRGFSSSRSIHLQLFHEARFEHQFVTFVTRFKFTIDRLIRFDRNNIPSRPILETENGKMFADIFFIPYPYTLSLSFGFGRWLDLKDIHFVFWWNDLRQEICCKICLRSCCIYLVVVSRWENWYNFLLFLNSL